MSTKEALKSIGHNPDKLYRLEYRESGILVEIPIGRTKDYGSLSIKMKMLENDPRYQTGKLKIVRCK